MLKKIETWMKSEHMVEDGDRIVAGVSGGADSVALLFVLLSLKEKYHLKLAVVHVNHGIRGEAAKRDADYVRKLCQDNDVPFYLYEESVPALSKEWKVSEEEAGRRLRYQCFFETAKRTKSFTVATAHHMGDQAETVLFHLIRGSNLAGAAGIRPVSAMEDIRVIRPLLCCEKRELMDYLKERHIPWCEDATNEDNVYARNKIRNQVMPALLEINKEAVNHIAGFAKGIAEYRDFLDSVVERYIQGEGSFQNADGGRLGTDRHRLAAQNPLLAKAVIYRMLAKVMGQQQDIAKEHVDSVYALLFGQSGKRLALPCQTQAAVSYEMLWIRKKEGDSTHSVFDYCISLEEIRNNEGEIRISLPNGDMLLAEICGPEEFENNVKNVKNDYTKVFDCDRIKSVLHVRTPLQEDYFVINDNGNRKRIARYFIDEKIPSEKRKEQILVAADNEVLWHVGGRRCERYKVKNTTEYILRLRYEGGYDEGANRGNDF